MTIIALQTALDALKKGLEPVWPIYKEIERTPNDLARFFFDTMDAEGFILLAKVQQMYHESAGGEERWKRIGEVTGWGGREVDSIPPEHRLGDKFSMRKVLAGWLLAYALSAEEKMNWAFKLADVNGDGYVDQKLRLNFVLLSWSLHSP